MERPDGDDHEPSIADLRYEVMFLLDAPDESIPGFKAAAEVGDSIVVVGGDGIFNCHIHCDDIGAAIECGIDVGRPHKIRVTDLLEEPKGSPEEDWVMGELGDLSRQARPSPPPSWRPPSATGWSRS